MEMTLQLYSSRGLMNVPEKGPDLFWIYSWMVERRRQFSVETQKEEEQWGFCPDFWTVDQIFTI